MRILPTTRINRLISAPQAFIAESEKAYLDQIERTAEVLADNRDEKPIILISGPSGSGKTTTAFRLRALLCDMGVNTHTLSMDNYFLSVHDPRNEFEEDGSIDFESPRRLDFDVLNEHMVKIINGEEFTLPIFDFKQQRRLDGEQFKRCDGEMVILEGIHALNPDVTGKVIENSAGVYVSVRTRISYGVGGYLHPCKIRLMRRLIRDRLFRNRKISDTLGFFKDVQRGEDKYILPYKCYAEHDIDTFIAYEAAVYREFLKEDLQELSGDFSDLRDVLTEIRGMGTKYVPSDSLTREFVGGSNFAY